MHSQSGLPALACKKCQQIIPFAFYFYAKTSPRFMNNNFVKHGKSTFDIKFQAQPSNMHPPSL
jgi:hypothetical protein